MLEEVVEHLSANRLTEWICLCYGNPLYTESAKKVFGNVGCPLIFSEEEKTRGSLTARRLPEILRESDSLRNLERARRYTVLEVRRFRD